MIADREISAQSSGFSEDQTPQQRDFRNPFGGNGDERPQPYRSSAMGSGFIIDAEGFIVTNNHVIELGEKISIKLPDGREFVTKLIGADAATDVAVLRNGAPRAITATIAARERGLALSSRPVPESPLATGSTLNLRLSALTPEMRDRFHIRDAVRGVLVIAVDSDSDAAQKRVSEGDVILSVENVPVHALVDVVAKVKDAKNARRESVLLLMAGQQGQRLVALELGKR